MKGATREMGKVLKIVKGKLEKVRKCDNESIRRMITETAREIGVTLREKDIKHAVEYLRYGMAIW